MLSRWRRLRDTAGDAGMTLVEVVVGMTLLSIVGAMALNFFVGTSTQAARVTTQALDGGGARTAVNQVATVLRLADTPTARPGYATSRFLLPAGQSTLSAAEIVFFANISSSDRSGTAVRTPPTKFDIKLVAGVLTEYQYAPLSTSYGTSYDWTTNYPSSPTTTTVLLSNVGNTNVFTYCSAATDQSRSCTPATTPDAISLVQVTLTVKALRGNAAQTVQSAVAITGAVS